jgi:glycosyltransferase involved in cell wall biosynthesis
MKIAVVSGPFLPIPPVKYGGTEEVIHHLIKGLKEAGHEPILVGTGDSTIDCEIIPITEKAMYFPRTKKGLKQHLEQVKITDRATTKILRQLIPRVDIIHSHGFDMSEFRDFPNVTTLHNKMTFHDLDYFLERKDLPYVSISLNQQAACPGLNYVSVVYNGEDPDKFPIVTAPEDYLCFLGRFDRDKNPHMAIQMAIHLKTKIKLAGKIDHDGKSYFDEEIKPYLNHPLVEYMGEIEFDEKVKLVANAKCNLHPTNFREPFGLTVLEAAYCGTPTLAVARGSMPELIEPERTGWLVEDLLEGRHFIEECYKMDREYIAMRARRLFNYRIMAQQYVDVYQNVINTHSDRGAGKTEDMFVKNLAVSLFR